MACSLSLSLQTWQDSVNPSTGAGMPRDGLGSRRRGASHRHSGRRVGREARPTGILLPWARVPTVTPADIDVTSGLSWRLCERSFFEAVDDASDAVFDQNDTGGSDRRKSLYAAALVVILRPD